MLVARELHLVLAKKATSSIRDLRISLHHKDAAKYRILAEHRSACLALLAAGFNSQLSVRQPFSSHAGSLHGRWHSYCTQERRLDGFGDPATKPRAQGISV